MHKYTRNKNESGPFFCLDRVSSWREDGVKNDNWSSYQDPSFLSERIHYFFIWYASAQAGSFNTKVTEFQNFYFSKTRATILRLQRLRKSKIILSNLLTAVLEDHPFLSARFRSDRIWYKTNCSLYDFVVSSESWV